MANAIYTRYLIPIGTTLELRPVERTFVREAIVPPAAPDEDVDVDICHACADLTVVNRRRGTGLTRAQVGELCVECAAFAAAHPEVYAFAQKIIWASRYILTTARR